MSVTRTSLDEPSFGSTPLGSAPKSASNPLIDALSGGLDLLAMPGDYTRGLLAGKPGERLDARKFLAGMGLASEQDDSWLGAGRDFAASMLTDPLTFLPMAGFAAKAGLAGKAARTAGTGAGKLKLARGQFPVVYGMEHGSDDLGTTVLGGLDAPGGREGWQAYARYLNKDMPTVSAGQFDNVDRLSPGMAVLRKQVDREAERRLSRHEVMHGLVHQAATQAPGAEKLPWNVRAVGSLMRAPDKTFARGFGKLADETLAHSAADPGALAQMKNAAKFLFGGNPESRAMYSNYFAQDSPLTAMMFDALPGAAMGAGVGLGVGVGYLGYKGGSALLDALNSPSAQQPAKPGQPPRWGVST